MSDSQIPNTNEDNTKNIKNIFFAQENLATVRAPEDSLLPPDPEDRVGRVLELSVDLAKRDKACSVLEEKIPQLFPGPGEKVSKVGNGNSH